MYLIGQKILLLSNRIGITGEKKEDGMELVQAGVLIAIAIIIGLIFKEQITNFVNDVLDKLNDDF